MPRSEAETPSASNRRSGALRLEPQGCLDPKPKTHQPAAEMGNVGLEPQSYSLQANVRKRLAPKPTPFSNRRIMQGMPAQDFKNAALQAISENYLRQNMQQTPIQTLGDPNSIHARLLGGDLHLSTPSG